MSRLAHTSVIRMGAQRFSAASDELRGRAARLNVVEQNLVNGARSWHGDGAKAFEMAMERLREDARSAAQAFERTAHAMDKLAGQLDHVNQLRQQADQLQNEMHALDQRMWGADEQERHALHQQISQLSYRLSQLSYEADAMERQANSEASSEFHAIMSQANHLHLMSSSDVHTGVVHNLLDQAGHFFSSLWKSAKDKAHEVEENVENYAKDLFHEAESALEAALDDVEAATSWMRNDASDEELFKQGQEHPDVGPNDHNGIDTTGWTAPPKVEWPEAGMSVEQLNEIIRNARTAHDFYEQHPDAKGPYGENALQMQQYVHQIAELARGYGGTVGVPTLFIPGLNSNAQTWKTMLSGMSNDPNLVGTWTETYSNLGPVLFRETSQHANLGFDWTHRAVNPDHPLIDVLFAHSALSSWKNETSYLDNVVQNVEQEYGTTHVNFVAHSQGGLVGLNYAEHHVGDTHVDKFVTLDTPFDGGNDPIPGTDLRYGYPNIQLGVDTNRYMTDKDWSTYNVAHGRAVDALKNTQVLSVYGSSDMPVIQSSAYALSHLNLEHFTTKLYPGLGHSDVHESHDAVVDVNQFLFQGLR